MTDAMLDALLDMYAALDLAAASQRLRGVHDQGARAKVTSGNHMNGIVEVLFDDLFHSGYAMDDLFFKRGDLALPGYFRSAKQWDLLCFDGEDLMAAIELKSINSSFGNNQNNRAEEAIGNAVDLEFATKNGLVSRRTKPPARCYVLIVCDCEKSRKPLSVPKSRYEIDPIFKGTNYQQRFEIMCSRLLDERLYEAVWLVFVDPEGETVKEPNPALSYDVFIETIASQLRINRMNAWGSGGYVQSSRLR